jgi:hypothetical protein
MRVAIALAATMAVVFATLCRAEDSHDTKLGTVAFANSCAPVVQDDFQRGVALLHSFQFTRSINVLSNVLDRDPKCAIATWGIAADWIGNTLALGTTTDDSSRAQAAIELGRTLDAPTQREKDYIEAIAAYYDHYGEKTYPVRMRALSDAFEALAARYPNDDEAQIFNALYLASSQAPTDKTYVRAKKAGDILNQQFAKHPDHPGAAHYLIHAFDYPSLAALGINAAICYADIAPDASHAAHMPSHIFTRVGAWKQSIDTNIRSIAAAKIEKNDSQILHDLDYMEYANLQLGRDIAAADIVKLASTYSASVQNAIFTRAAIPARYALERNQWSDAARLPDPAQSKFPWTEAMIYYARGLGSARAGNPADAAENVTHLEQIRDSLKTENTYWSTEVEVQRATVAAWISYAGGSRDQALSQMRSAADLEDSSEKNVVTPGRILPARELLADMLLDANYTVEALTEYENSLKRDPKRFRSFAGAARAAVASNKASEAQTYYASIVGMVDSKSSRDALAEASAFLAAK